MEWKGYEVETVDGDGWSYRYTTHHALFAKDDADRHACQSAYEAWRKDGYTGWTHVGLTSARVITDGGN